MTTFPDLTTREDIVRLVDAFYARVRADARLNPIFEDIAHVDWAQHLPRMYAFWESVLFAGTAYRGDPLAVHRELGRHVSLTPLEFGRWLELFDEAMDALFAGPHADQAKLRASRIAVVMQQHATADRVRALP
ncbi:MAG: group III truncated hemoglobin [bacterium]